jgi:hypothetical protein
LTAKNWDSLGARLEAETEIIIDIVNFTKHNPKKTTSWFKLRNDWFDDPKLCEVPPIDRYIYVALCGLRGTSGVPLRWLSVGALQARLRLSGTSIVPRLVNLQKYGLIILHLPYIQRKKENKHQKREEKAKIGESEPSVPKFDFESVYRDYPRKLGKSPGLKKCRTHVKTEADYESLKYAIERYKQHCASNHVEAKFIMHFSTFMNQWRDWLDLGHGESLSVQSGSGSAWPK